jgi:hopanoid biosynthesis associated protein HpnK
MWDRASKPGQSIPLIYCSHFPCYPSPLRRLIINADDFGLTPGVNRAIAETHHNGIVTSATLMANSRAFSEAVELAKKEPKLSVGCHVVLVDGEPLLPVSEVSSLLTKDSRFPTGFGAIAKAALTQKLNVAEIESEVTAQIRHIQNAGVSVTHVDSHKHVHMLPPVGAAIIRAARDCGVRAIRNPFVPVKPLALAHLTRRPQLWKRYAQTKILRRYEREFLRQVADAGMITTDGSFGVISTGSLDAELFRAVVGSIPDGTWEFVCHPGYIDNELGTIRTRLRESREKELAVLISEEARAAIADRHIELISYADLAANQ